MDIAVFMKQVADNTKLRFSESGPILEGATMMMNPYDEYALETAIRLKEAVGGDSTVTVFCLGQPSAKEVIKKAIAAGADAAFQLSDAAFENGDSTSTAVALSQALKTQLPNAGALFFGQMSLDDAGSQTGPKVAELLDLPSLSAVKLVEKIDDNTLQVTRETERGVEVHHMTLPGVLCVMKCDYELRSSNIKGVMKANKTEIPALAPAALGLGADGVGEGAASVALQKMWKKPPKSPGQTIDGTDPQGAVNGLIDYLRQAKVL